LAIKNQFAFEAKADVNQAKLTWLSNGGLKNDYFVVERSSATSDFETIQLVNAKTAGADLKDYTFVDANPVEGDNFYRIKTVEMNGNVSVSDIKTLTFGKVQDVRIFPNPASEFIDVDLKVYEGRQVNIFMYNGMGKLVNTTNVESATSAPLHIDIDNFTSGSYLIRVQVEGKRDVIKQVQITN
jgi:Secretion system C-terminal sorting domain